MGAVTSQLFLSSVPSSHSECTHAVRSVTLADLVGITGRLHSEWVASFDRNLEASVRSRDPDGAERLDCDLIEAGLN